MPFAQVVEENGQKKLAPVPGGIAGGGVDAEARALAGQAKEIAEAALPISGGTMTGPVSNLKLAELGARMYDASAVSSQWTQDNFCRNFPWGEGSGYVGGPNASDTDGLFEGRGLSPEMPFATLGAAWDWFRMYHYNNGYVPIFLQDDVEWGTDDYPQFASATMNCIHIASVSTAALRTLTLPHGLTVASGFLKLSSLKLNFPRNGGGAALTSNGGSLGSSPTLWVNNCELTGSVEKVIHAYNNGTVFVTGCAGAISGKKYLAEKCGRIIGATGIPGTTAGTVDASSQVI